MEYTIELKPRALKDLKKIPNPDKTRIIEKNNLLKDGLSGKVKQLTNHTEEYRLRVGDWRVLFDVEGTVITVYRVKPRGNAYSR